MTALFMLFADAALAATYPPSQAGKEDSDIIVIAPGASRGTAWSPNVDDWYDDTPTCPYVYEDEIPGFGTVRVGPGCGQGTRDSLARPLAE